MNKTTERKKKKLQQKQGTKERKKQNRERRKIRNGETKREMDEGKWRWRNGLKGRRRGRVRGAAK